MSEKRYQLSVWCCWSLGIAVSRVTDGRMEDLKHYVYAVYFCSGGGSGGGLLAKMKVDSVHPVWSDRSFLVSNIWLCEVGKPVSIPPLSMSDRLVDVSCLFILATTGKIKKALSLNQGSRSKVWVNGVFSPSAKFFSPLSPGAGSAPINLIMLLTCSFLHRLQLARSFGVS